MLVICLILSGKLFHSTGPVVKKAFALSIKNRAVNPLQLLSTVKSIMYYHDEETASKTRTKTKAEKTLHD